MSSPPALQIAARGVAVARIGVGLLVILVLAYAYGVGIARDGANLFDYFGYFTNLTSLLTSAALILAGGCSLAGRPAPIWLMSLRAVGTACMLVVAVIYNVLVPGTGSAPAWVSAVLHIVFPALVALDWALVGDRPPLPWRRLWIVLPYPIAWLGIVLARGATDGWVPYGFLLPERGALSLLTHIVGLLGFLIAAGATVWAASRLPGFPRRSA